MASIISGIGTQEGSFGCLWSPLGVGAMWSSRGSFSSPLVVRLRP
jgi:hypothetical protein